MDVNQNYRNLLLAHIDLPKKQAVNPHPQERTLSLPRTEEIAAVGRSVNLLAIASSSDVGSFDAVVMRGRCAYLRGKERAAWQECGRLF